MLTVFAIIACVLFAEANLVLGNNANIEDYPYQVSLQCQGLGHICGGSIISKHYILTAAHCRVIASNIDESYVRVGSNVNNKGGRVHKVTEFMIQNRYHYVDPARPVHDIAIIKVSKPFQYDDTCQPIKLFDANAEPTFGTKAIVVGYGWLSEHESNVKLHSVVLNMIDKKTCEEAHKVLPENQICASGDDDKGTSYGDSGDPLVIDGRLAGIFSWSRLCGNTMLPSVYTEVSRYRDWINEHVQFD